MNQVINLNTKISKLASYAQSYGDINEYFKDAHTVMCI